MYQTLSPWVKSQIIVRIGLNHAVERNSRVSLAAAHIRMMQALFDPMMRSVPNGLEHIDV
jgi:hypothetical protein